MNKFIRNIGIVLFIVIIISLLFSKSAYASKPIGNDHWEDYGVATNSQNLADLSFANKSQKDKFKPDYFEKGFVCVQDLFNKLNQCGMDKRFSIGANKANIEAFFTKDAKDMSGKFIGAAWSQSDYQLGMNGGCWKSKSFDGKSAYYREIKGVIDIKNDGVYLDNKKILDDPDMLQKVFYAYYSNYNGNNDGWSYHYWLMRQLQTEIYNKLDKDDKEQLKVLNYNESGKEANISLDGNMNGNDYFKNPYTNYEYRILVCSGGNVAGAQEVVFFAAREATSKGKIRIIKADSQYNTIRLNGAEFKIYSEAKKQYIKDGSVKKIDGSTYELNDSVDYTADENKAQIFTTGGEKGVEGYIDITNVPIGKYTIKETKAPTNYKIEKGEEITINVKAYDKDKKDEYFFQTLSALTKYSAQNVLATKGEIYKQLTGKEYPGENKNSKLNDGERYAFIQRCFNSQYTEEYNGNEEKLQDILGNTDKIKTYVARVYGRHAKNDSNYYAYTNDVKDANVLRIYSKTQGWSCASKVASNQNLGGHLTIIKTSKDNNKLRVNGAKYILYDETKNKYIKADDQTKKEAQYVFKSYVDKSADATRFESGKGKQETGYIQIDMLDTRHTYTLIEVEAPSGYEIAEPQKGIKVKSYARSGEYRLEYLIEAFKNMFNYNDGKNKDKIAYALTGKTNGKYYSTTKTGLINEILLYNNYTETYSENKKFTYKNLKDALDHKDDAVLKEYMTRVYNRYKNTKTATTDNTYVLKYYTMISGYSSVLSIEDSKTSYGNLKIIKVSKDTDTKLKGAQFIVRVNGTEDKYVMAEGENGNYKAERYETNGDSYMKLTNVEHASVFETNDDGTIEISGLDNQCYDIIEIKAPNGYSAYEDENMGYKLEDVDKDGNEDLVVYGTYTDSNGVTNYNCNVQASNRDKYINYVIQTLETITSGTKNLEWALTGKGNANTNTSYTSVKDVIYATNFSNNTKITTKELELPMPNSEKLRKYIAEVLNRINSTTKYDLQDGMVYTYYYRMCGYTVVRIKNNEDIKPGDLRIRKIDEDSQNPLAGVEFKIYDNTEKKWLDYDSNGNISYKLTSQNAKAFITEIDGYTPVVSSLDINHSYNIYETNIPEDLKDLYELDTITLPGDTNSTYAKLIGENVYVNSNEVVEKTYTNKKKAQVISISGYVWQDNPGNYDDKTTMERNNQYDGIDYKVKGVKVKLVDSSGAVVKNNDGKACETITDSYGEYKFENIQKDKIGDYHVEFEYDGLIYQNVISKSEDSYVTTSKAKENTRTQYNSYFNQITGQGQQIGLNGGITLNYEKDGNNEKLVDGSSTSQYSYNDHDGTQKTGIELQLSENYAINATTKDNLNLLEYYEQHFTGDGEIKYLNLGLYVREKPDLAIKKDIYSADISVDGNHYTYKYNQNLVSEKMQVDTKTGVSFQNPRTEEYKLPIYKADYTILQNSTNNNDEYIKVQYKVALINESNLYATVNSITDYFSEKYNYNGNIYLGDIDKPTSVLSNNVNVKEQGQEYGYKKYSFENLNVKISPYSASYLYIEYEISKDIINQTELSNVVEISSYSVYSDSEYKNNYAGIDKDSIPSSTKVNDTKTYEDDTDKALGLKLVVNDDSPENGPIKGKVFLDSIDENKLEKENIRQGNGQYDGESEEGIEGIEVRLVNSNGDTVTTTLTAKNGEYSFDRPACTEDNYKIEFEWGRDSKYNVNDYKGTITRQNVANDWCQKDTIRYSDAKDNWAFRQEIDKQNRDTMIATTANFQTWKLEYKTFYETEYQYDEKGNKKLDENGKPIATVKEVQVPNWIPRTISYIDYGIVERPKQTMQIKKEVSNVKLSSADGKVLVDLKVKDGTFEDENNIKYIKIVEKSAISPFGRISAEIDQELFPIQADIGYKVTVENTSELDYKDENYYLYGIKPANDDNIVKSKANGVYDYVNQNMEPVQDAEKYSIITKEEFNNQISQISGTGAKTAIEKQYDTWKTENGYTFEKNSYKWVEQKYTAIFEQWGKTTTEIRKQRVNNKIIRLTTLENELKPGEESSIEFTTQGIYANSDEIKINNDAEIVKYNVSGEYGRKVVDIRTPIYDRAEEVTITPPTGENKQITPWVIISISAMAVLGIGIIFIKKKVLK